VKVDRLGIAIVNLGLGLGEEVEGLDREGLGGGADGSGGDDLANLRQAAMDLGCVSAGRILAGVGMLVLVRVLVTVRVLVEV